MNSTSYVLKSDLPGDKRLFKKFGRERFNCSRNLYRKDILSHYACVNSISFSRDGEMFVSGMFFELLPYKENVYHNQQNFQILLGKICFELYDIKKYN